MTDAVLHPTAIAGSAASPWRRFTALLGYSPRGTEIAQNTDLALDELPDSLLSDIGLTRSDIPFVAGALVSGDSDPAREALDQLNGRVAERDIATRLSHVALRLI